MSTPTPTDAPVLPPNPHSVVGSIARGVLVVPPTPHAVAGVTALVDALDERNRADEAREVRRAFAGVAGDVTRENGYAGMSSVWLSWDTFVSKMRRMLFWDLWSWDGGVQVVGAAVSGEPPKNLYEELDSTDPMGPMDGDAASDPPPPASGVPFLTANVTGLTPAELGDLNGMIQGRFGGRGVTTFIHDVGEDAAPPEPTDLYDDKENRDHAAE